jgi:uncharacterized phage protein (TIGR01671 family)
MGIYGGWGMREIIFRGQQVRGWFQKGHYYVNEEGKHLICFTEKRHRIYGETIEYAECAVGPETIGQYTGLKDKNGKMIFEGDIVKSDIDHIGDIQFDSGMFGIEWARYKENKLMTGSWGQVHNLRRIDDGFNNEIEIIGNIHDNPELLKEKDKP